MARKRLRALSAIEVWRRPVGVPGEEWVRHAGRGIYRNGHQARRYTDQFQILLPFYSAAAKLRLIRLLSL